MSLVRVLTDFRFCQGNLFVLQMRILSGDITVWVNCIDEEWSCIDQSKMSPKIWKQPWKYNPSIDKKTMGIDYKLKSKDTDLNTTDMLDDLLMYTYFFSVRSVRFFLQVEFYRRKKRREFWKVLPLVLCCVCGKKNMGVFDGEELCIFPRCWNALFSLIYESSDSSLSFASFEAMSI